MHLGLSLHHEGLVAVEPPSPDGTPSPPAPDSPFLAAATTSSSAYPNTSNTTPNTNTFNTTSAASAAAAAVASNAAPRLLLSHLVSRHISAWADESADAARAALGYLWLLRAHPAARQALAATALLNTSRAAEALLPREAVGFVDDGAYRALVSEVGAR